MKITFLFIPLLFFSFIGFSQNIVIKGQAIDGESNLPINGVFIYFDSNHYTYTDESGLFNLVVNKINNRDTLKIRNLGCFSLNFINLPSNTHLIEFKNIPIFEYSAEYDMTEFFCGTFDLKCKRERKKHLNTEKARVEKYYTEQNQKISQYQLSCNNQIFIINVKTQVVDLKGLIK